MEKQSVCPINYTILLDKRAISSNLEITYNLGIATTKMFVRVSVCEPNSDQVLR